MRPLLWKEMRELRPWLAGAGALLLVLRLAFLSRGFAEQFLSPYIVMMPLAGLAAAIALGASQMARERGAKTLDFLLARPIAPAAIVWIKFLAGSVALALLLAAMTALCYVDPRSPRRDYLIGYLSAVAFPYLAAELFPRLWCAYALTLWLSAMLDRTAKAAVASFACVLGLGFLIGVCSDPLFPFSNVWVWRPIDDHFIMSLRLLHDPALFRLTSFTFGATAPLLALTAAQSFRRSPGWAMSNRALILSAAAAAGLIALSTYAAANRLSVQPPVGTLEFDMRENPTMGAGGGMVVLAIGDSIQFLDFTDPAKPRNAALARMPLWTTHSLTVAGGRAYLLGAKKALPADEMQIAIASLTPSGTVQFAEPIPLGTAHESWFTGSVAVSGHFAYVGAERPGLYKVGVYDLSPGASGRQAAALVVDDFFPPVENMTVLYYPGIMRMALSGQYLYVTTPSALTAIDIHDPERPVVTSRTEYRNPLRIVAPTPREVASNGRWLLEAEPVLQEWEIYDMGEPGHPALRGHVPRYGAVVVNSAALLLETWRNGLLEFRTANGGLEELRYLTDGRDFQSMSMAAADGYAYTLKGKDEHRYVSAFRVKP